MSYTSLLLYRIVAAGSGVVLCHTAPGGGRLSSSSGPRSAASSRLGRLRRSSLGVRRAAYGASVLNDAGLDAAGRSRLRAGRRAGRGGG